MNYNDNVRMSLKDLRSIWKDTRTKKPRPSADRSSQKLFSLKTNDIMEVDKFKPLNSCETPASKVKSIRQLRQSVKSEIKNRYSSKDKTNQIRNQYSKTDLRLKARRKQMVELHKKKKGPPVKNRLLNKKPRLFHDKSLPINKSVHEIKQNTRSKKNGSSISKDKIQSSTSSMIQEKLDFPFSQAYKSGHQPKRHRPQTSIDENFRRQLGLVKKIQSKNPIPFKKRQNDKTIFTGVKVSKYIRGDSQPRYQRNSASRGSSRSRPRPISYLSPQISKNKLMSSPKTDDNKVTFSSSGNIRKMIKGSVNHLKRGQRPENGSISDFRLYGKKLGEGAYAVVRPAKHLETGEMVAIKTYNRLKLVEPKKLRAVRREISIIQQISHNNIAMFVDIRENRRNIHLVLENAGKKNLMDIISKKSLSTETIKSYFKQLVEAVHYLHNHGIVHRDLKLENVVIGGGESPVVKLVDFGFAAEIPQKGSQLLRDICGTPNYMSPELCKRKAYDGKVSDCWALGIILFYMFTKEFPFQGKSEYELIENIVSRNCELSKIEDEGAHDLISKILLPKPIKERLTIEQFKKHPFLTFN